MLKLKVIMTEKKKKESIDVYKIKENEDKYCSKYKTGILVTMFLIANAT